MIGVFLKALNPLESSLGWSIKMFQEIFAATQELQRKLSSLFERLSLRFSVGFKSSCKYKALVSL